MPSQTVDHVLGKINTCNNVGFCHISFQSVERVLVPHLPIYMPHLQETMEFQGRNFLQLQTEATRVHGAILVCNHNSYKA